MKLFLTFLFKVTIVSLLVIELASFILLYTFRNTDFYKTTFAYKHSGSKYDFVILGSSRGLTSIDTRRVERCLGQVGFNFSVDDTHIGSQLLMLRHLLYHNISFDTLFLVYETHQKNIDSVATNDYRFIPFVYNDYVREYFYDKNANGYYKSAYYVPFVPMAYYNVEVFFSSLFSLMNPDFRHRYGDAGDYDYPVEKTVDSSISSTKMVINFDNTDLKEIREICVKNSINLIVLVTPSYRTDYEFVGYTENYSIVDLSDSLNEPNFFYDRVHLNKAGKDALTSVLIRRLNECQ